LITGSMGITLTKYKCKLLKTENNG
jgi:hypothetical protein